MKAQLSENRLRALELVSQGTKIVDIAKMMNVTETTIRRYIDQALAANLEREQEIVGKLRHEQLAQIRAQKQTLVPLAAAGNMRAHAELTKLHAREGVLMGLDLNTQKIEVEQKVTLTVADLDAARALGQQAVDDEALLGRLEDIASRMADVSEARALEQGALPAPKEPVVDAEWEEAG